VGVLLNVTSLYRSGFPPLLQSIGLIDCIVVFSCSGAAIDTIDALALALLPVVDSGTLVPQADVSYQSVVLQLLSFVPPQLSQI
jgi:hypothetical protein